MEPKPGSKVTLDELLGDKYRAESYYSEAEMSMIKHTFKDNPALIAVLRKIFLPTVADPQLPIEQMGQDAWMTGTDFSLMPVDEVKGLVLGRQSAIKFIMGGLVQLKMLANGDDGLNRAERRKLDSAK